MSRLRHALLICIVAGIAACSGGDVTLDIDVLSFLTGGGDNPEPARDYAVLLPPTGVFVQGITIVPATEIRLVDVIDDLTVVDEGMLLYRIEAVNRKGRADASLRVRLAASRDGLDAPGAAADVIPLALWPDSTTTSVGEIELGDDLVEVFANDRIWLQIESDLRVDPAQVIGDSLAGRLVLRGLDVRIVADEDFF